MESNSKSSFNYDNQNEASKLKRKKNPDKFCSNSLISVLRFSSPKLHLRVWRTWSGQVWVILGIRNTRNSRFTRYFGIIEKGNCSPLGDRQQANTWIPDGFSEIKIYIFLLSYRSEPLLDRVYEDEEAEELQSLADQVKNKILVFHKKNPDFFSFNNVFIPNRLVMLIKDPK